MKLNAIGVLVLDDKGKIKAHKIGRRSWGKGAGIGVVLAAIAPPTLLAGALAGGVLGALHHKGLGVETPSGTDRRRTHEWPSGHRGPGRRTEAPEVSDKLTELGGELHVLSPSEEAVAEVDAAAAQVEAAEAAAEPDAPATAD